MVFVIVVCMFGYGWNILGGIARFTVNSARMTQAGKHQAQRKLTYG
jgi:hypothetical protein